MLTLSHETEELPNEDNRTINEGTSTNLKDYKLYKSDKGTKFNIGKTCSPLIDKISNQLQETTVCSSGKSNLSAAKNGKSCSLLKDLKIIHFCVDYNKMFAVCETKKTAGNPKTICLYVLDLTSGKLQLVRSLFDNDIQFVDMCMSKIEHWKCIAFAYTEHLPSLAEYWFIRFIKLGGENRRYRLALERSSLGPICSFNNTLLSYDPEGRDILVFDTRKWPIEANDRCFDIGLDFDVVVTDLMTCSGKEPSERLVMVEYLAVKGHGILCLDLKGNKLWEISPSSDPYPMHYPRGDNTGHIFLIDYSSQAILVRKGELTPEVLLKLPAGIDNYRWSNTMNKLVVLHYNEKRDSLLVSCYDIVEQ